MGLKLETELKSSKNHKIHRRRKCQMKVGVFGVVRAFLMIASIKLGSNPRLARLGFSLAASGDGTTIFFLDESLLTEMKAEAADESLLGYLCCRRKLGQERFLLRKLGRLGRRERNTMRSVITREELHDERKASVEFVHAEMKHEQRRR
ncbi:uncharacterized protein LOC121268288 [Juglans microcarpa x Juglans regia]|uniref:uncharacterized protein LOC121268288 n=1 Tax=Juglans microcarpa x Juglans regia TaxID=2249226 RepID=UPI001B7E49D6|nr:uncharacterized protein LOC121268288 [Juglans microcarpa x Juglans regia]